MSILIYFARGLYTQCLLSEQEQGQKAVSLNFVLYEATLNKEVSYFILLFDYINCANTPSAAWFNCLHATCATALVAVVPHTVPHIPPEHISRRTTLSLEDSVSLKVFTPLHGSRAAQGIFVRSVAHAHTASL